MGSSEADPDPVVALLKLRNEVYALNPSHYRSVRQRGRRPIPVPTYRSAQIEKGVVGTHACCVFLET
jgi:hypothetical protein